MREASQSEYRRLGTRRHYSGGEASTSYHPVRGGGYVEIDEHESGSTLGDVGGLDPLLTAAKSASVDETHRSCSSADRGAVVQQTQRVAARDEALLLRRQAEQPDLLEFERRVQPGAVRGNRVE